jgi:hypothetical protein
MLNNFYNFITIFNDAPQPFQIGFQDSAAPGFTGIVELHNTIFFYLVFISVSVFWVLTSIIYYFNSTKSAIVHKYLNHGTLLELIWTVSPAFILIAIAFPSFRLLYLLDYPCENIDILISSSIVSSIPSIKPKSKLEDKAKDKSKAKVVKSNRSITNKHSECTAIVPYGSITSSTLGIRLNKMCRTITLLFYAQREQIVGHMLGDGCIVYARSSVIPYFMLRQAFFRFNYLWFAYNLLSPFCGSLPGFYSSIRKGKRLFAVYFCTRSYPFLIGMHSLFYSLVDGKWVKHISTDLFFELTPRALAFWFMDDGAFAKSGVYLHTNGFNFLDVYKLAGMLHYLFDLNVSVQSHENRPVIYVKAESVGRFKSLVFPYMHPSMYYKFGKK